MPSTRKSLAASVLAGSIIAISTVMSPVVHAQAIDGKAAAQARTEYRNASNKINTEFRAKRATCAKMTGTDRAVCQVDARAARTKAVADATAARDKAYLKANMLTADDFVNENGSGED